MFHLTKLLQPCSWGLNWSWCSPGRRQCWHLFLMVNEIYIYIYTQAGDIKSGWQVMGSFWPSMKVNKKSPRGSAWLWNQNTPFLGVSWHADGQHATRREEEKGLWGLCNVPSIKWNKPAIHNQGEEGGGRRPRATARQCHHNVGKPTHSERVSAGISALVARITTVPRAQLHNA